MELLVIGLFIVGAVLVLRYVARAALTVYLGVTGRLGPGRSVRQVKGEKL